ncbi:hypothetical protein ABEB36_001017 [Hypothenemus hampei]|uniref:E3 ubiquitin-protein ligase E3D n=1 Tax=Hypothenemus hampei TaxID=57062 RepID=A0ABD1FFT6_HYPHA
MENSFKVVLSEEQAFTVKFHGYIAKPFSLSSVKASKSFISFRFCTVPELGSYKTEVLSSQPDNSNGNYIKRIVEDTLYKLECSNCERELSSTKFNRVLPLPENLDQNDWFCHAPAGNVMSLEPGSKDLFYGNCFCHIHSDIIKNTLTKNQVFVCKSCLNWLGVKCGFSSLRSLEDEQGSLYLWLLEKELKIVIDDRETACAKVLFKFSDQRHWSQDPNVETVEISKPMMIDLIKHLHKNNQFFPKEFSMSNDFYVSYIFMYENVS